MNKQIWGAVLITAGAFGMWIYNTGRAGDFLDALRFPSGDAISAQESGGSVRDLIDAWVKTGVAMQRAKTPGFNPAINDQIMSNNGTSDVPAGGG